MRIAFDTNSVSDYERFIAVKSLPKYRFCGAFAEFPDEYASIIGASVPKQRDNHYLPIAGLFDYQRDIAKMAISKKKFSVFADCGLGKTLILLEFARHAAESLPKGKAVLIVSPLMVVSQTMEEAKRFYGDTMPIEQVHASGLTQWLTSGKARIGITNYDALVDETPQGRIGALILDESSMLKSHYGKWGTKCIEMGRGIEYKLALTGTPAPNDRIEYANHAVFCDAFPNVNSFLARFFVNRGQTQERWALKPHALKPFYRALSHWCIFLTNPSTYGWKDNCANIPPIHVHIHDIPLTPEQRALVHGHTGALFADRIGGITSRTTMGRLAKGTFNGEQVPTNKPDYIRSLVNSWPDESTIVWCLYNDEQDRISGLWKAAANIDGSTPHEQRMRMIGEFKAGIRRVMVSKPKILGFGLNLQRATRQVFSGLQDSYESYYQAVKRSNRYGSTRPLNVHIPVTEIERPMIETVLEKAKRVQQDTEEQEALFRDSI